MGKKISALLLALVLCFSVVVVPVSAAGFSGDYALPEGNQFAYKLEWDKASYNPGETAVLNVYMHVADDMELYTGTFAVGLNSSVIAQADNSVDQLRSNAVAGDVWTRYWKAPAASTISWLAPKIISMITDKNTTEENALYDQYMKYVISRNTTSGTGENAGDNTHGVTSAEINASAEPVMQLKYTISKDAKPGTPINAAITSGTLTSAPAKQTTQKYYTQPGVTNKTADIQGFDLSQAVAKAVVAGGEQPQVSVLKQEKRQVKMKWEDQSAGTILAGSHQMRVISQVAEADLQKLVGATDDAAIAGKILNAGIVAFKGNKADFDMKAAKALVQGDALTAGDYSKSETGYIQHADGVYRFGARVEYKSNLYDTAYVTYLAYTDADGATQYLFMDAAEELLYATKQTDIENLWKGGQPKA